MGSIFFKKGADKLQPTAKSFFEFELNNIDGKNTKLAEF